MDLNLINKMQPSYVQMNNNISKDVLNKKDGKVESTLDAVSNFKKTDNLTMGIELDRNALPPAVPFESEFGQPMYCNDASFNYKVTTDIVDSQGNEHELTAYFVKAHAVDSWNLHVGIDDIDVTPVSELDGQTTMAYTLLFNENGTLNLNNAANPSKYYGATPVASNNLGPLTVTDEKLTAVEVGDFTINGIAINASVADSFSTKAEFASARAMVDNINAKSVFHGVTAINNPEGNQIELNHGSYSLDTLTAGQFVINGESITGLADNDASLVELINSKISNTGIFASTKGENIKLTAFDNRNIHIKSNGSVNFSNLENDIVQKGRLQLSTFNDEAIVVGGNKPEKAGFTNGPLAGIVNTSSDRIEILKWDPKNGSQIHDKISIDLSKATQKDDKQKSNKVLVKMQDTRFLEKNENLSKVNGITMYQKFKELS